MGRERVFAASFGAYAGCLLGAAGSLVLPGPTWPVTFAGFLVTASVGYWMALRLDLAVNLTGVWRNLSLVLFPFVYLLLLVNRPPGLSPAQFLATPATVGLLAFLPGLFVVIVGDLHRNRTMFENATVHAEFESLPAPRSRRLQLAGGAFVVLSGVGGGALLLVVGGDPGAFASLVTAMGGLSTLIAAKDAEREVAVTDAGLKVQMQVHDWDTFSDYEVTDDALVLERPKRRHSTFKFDREDVENLDDVEAALKRYLPREQT